MSKYTYDDTRFYVVKEGDRFYVHDRQYPSTYLWFDDELEANKLVDFLQSNKTKGYETIDEFLKIIDGEL